MSWYPKVIWVLFVVLLIEGLSVKSLTGAAPQGAIMIAAASDLQFAMEEIVAGFKKEKGVDVRVSYGSSGSFFAQIKAGAPFDLFFSADAAYPKRLAAEGIADPDSFFIYGTGRIVLWTLKGTSVDLHQEEMKGLLHPFVRKIAIANPAHAPYGKAAVAALRHFGLYDQLQSRLVFGENISQAAQFLQAGAAEMGILSLSLAIAPQLKEVGQYWLIPTEAHPSIEQGAIILRRSRSVTLARSFFDFVREGEGRAILKRFGFSQQGGAE